MERGVIEMKPPDVEAALLVCSFQVRETNSKHRFVKTKRTIFKNKQHPDAP